jgi:hypothetical protein
MAWFRNSYRHDDCDVGWTDEWSCACNDRCPVCDAEIEPYDFVDLTVVLEPDGSGKQWAVLVSPPTAEHRPNYVETCFERKQDAEAFAEKEIQRLGEQNCENSLEM